MAEEPREELQRRVEQVVRDVVASLRTGVGRAATGAGVPANTRELERPETMRSQRRTFVLATRLITLSTLEGKLENVGEIQAPRDAVITPAVQDLLREKRIRLARQEATNNCGEPQITTLVVGVAECKRAWVTSRQLNRVLAVPAEAIARAGLVEVIQEMAERIVSGGERGLLFTEAVAAALCLANRHRGVRAVSGRNEQEVRQAVSSVDANCLVLCPSGLSTWQQLRMAACLVASENIDGPTNYRWALD